MPSITPALKGSSLACDSYLLKMELSVMWLAFSKGNQISLRQCKTAIEQETRAEYPNYRSDEAFHIYSVLFLSELPPTSVFSLIRDEKVRAGLG